MRSILSSNADLCIPFRVIDYVFLNFPLLHQCSVLTHFTPSGVVLSACGISTKCLSTWAEQLGKQCRLVPIYLSHKKTALIPPIHISLAFQSAYFHTNRTKTRISLIRLQSPPSSRSGWSERAGRFTYRSPKERPQCRNTQSVPRMRPTAAVAAAGSSAPSNEQFWPPRAASAGQVIQPPARPPPPPPALIPEWRGGAALCAVYCVPVPTVQGRRCGHSGDLGRPLNV